MLTRYLTRWFVSVDENEAQRLAQGVGTHLPEITESLELLHAQDGWAFWSDGRVTTSTGLPDPLRAVRSLSPAAVELISGCFHGSPGGPPRIEGGWGALARVAAVEADELVEGRAEGPFDPPRLRRLRVRLADGAELEWWVRTAAGAEGVCFELGGGRGVATTPP